MSSNIEKGIIGALNNIGIFLDIEDMDDMAIGELLPDSLAFISFVVELENAFDIEIPDEYLLIDRLSSMDAIKQMIEDLA